MDQVPLQEFAQGLLDELRLSGTAERAVKEKEYLKSALEHFGTPVPKIRKLTQKRLRAVDLDREATLELARLLWDQEIHESRSAAVEALRFQVVLLEAEDLERIEEMLRESKTWALVDNLAVFLTGRLLERFPESVDVLDRWAVDDDFWVRRSALLALLLPLRRGEGDFARFVRYAEPMLEEKEFFIRKAIGWVLREAGKKRPEMVCDWLLPRVARASGLTVREAAKALPDDLRERLIAAKKAA